jgi:hypothetical protein
MNKFTTSGLLLLVLSMFIAPAALAEMSGSEVDSTDNRVEQYDELTKPQSDSSATETMESEENAAEANTRSEERLENYRARETSNNDSLYDVRRTEAFNLVSSAYRGDFEEQGIDGYGVMVSNYESGQLTAEDVINAAIEAGELSPNALNDDSYIDAVEFQLDRFDEG